MSTLLSGYFGFLLGEIALFRELGSLSGQVSKSGSDGGGIHVSVMGTSLETYSSPTGEWSIEDVPTGRALLAFSAEHYVTQEVDEISVIAQQNLRHLPGTSSSAHLSCGSSIPH